MDDCVEPQKIGKEAAAAAAAERHNCSAENAPKRQDSHGSKAVSRFPNNTNGDSRKAECLLGSVRSRAVIPVHAAPVLASELWCVLLWCAALHTQRVWLPLSFRKRDLRTEARGSVVSAGRL